MTVGFPYVTASPRSHPDESKTSFFARYTRDISDFADKYTEGKVVSVLEGGYSNRALTSAAMGHTIGLLNQPGESSWWTEFELSNVIICMPQITEESTLTDFSFADRKGDQEEANRENRTFPFRPVFVPVSRTHTRTACPFRGYKCRAYGCCDFRYKHAAAWWPDDTTD